VFATVVLPTFNERESLPLAVEAVRRALGDRADWEVVVVDDDSPDRTWEVAEALGRADPRVRVYRRLDRRGLSSAIVDGLSLGRGERLLVMDADLQHDVAKVPDLLAALDAHEVAVGTRYAGGGGTGDWGRVRRWLSRVATNACRWLLRIRVSDPMSGFFAIRADAFRRLAGRLDPRGYKILMEILYHHGPEGVAEVPYVFQARRLGESKLDGAVAADYLWSLLELATHRALHARFLKYCLVGLSGVGVQLGTLTLLLLVLPTAPAEALAIACAVVSNYVLNNAFTFRDRPHRTGRERALGLLTFGLVAAAGAFINWSVSLNLHEHGGWNLHVANLVGIALATVWNYVLNVGITWKGWSRPE
jgi:dolichol-phosphate mannosyltransferase